MAVTYIGTGANGPAQTSAQITIEIRGSQSGQNIYVPPQLQNLYGPVEQRLINLVSGNNTVNVPSTAGGMHIKLPEGNIHACRVWGGGTDNTGIALTRSGGQALFTFETTPPSAIILNAGGNIAGVLITFF